MYSVCIYDSLFGADFREQTGLILEKIRDKTGQKLKKFKGQDLSQNYNVPYKKISVAVFHCPH